MSILKSLFGKKEISIPTEFTINYVGPDGCKTEKWVVGDHIDVDGARKLFNHWKSSELYVIYLFRNGEREEVIVSRSKFNLAKKMMAL
jgi:hypothetical protein